MNKKFWITPVDKGAFLRALLFELAGSAQVAIEGDLGEIDFSHLPLLKEIDGEIAPAHSEENQFAVLALEANSVEPIIEALLAGERLSQNIEHIQVQKYGELQALIGDYFHEECVSVGEAVGEPLLRQLVLEGVIKRFETPEQVRARSPW